jgi:hypothetical protein
LKEALKSHSCTVVTSALRGAPAVKYVLSSSTMPCAMCVDCSKFSTLLISPCPVAAAAVAVAVTAVVVLFSFITKCAYRLQRGYYKCRVLLCKSDIVA